MSNISDFSLFSDKTILNTIGLFVQQTRIKQNLNQQELADRAAVSRSTVSLLERGENISLINLLKILRILDALYVLKEFEVREEISPLRLAKGEKKLRKRVLKKDTSQVIIWIRMVTTAFINIFGQRVGAVAYDTTTEMASFEYDPKFNLEKLPIAPIKMPSKNRIYSFPEHRNSETFKGMPGLLADTLPDRYGKDLINAWLARQGRPDDSLNPVELLCFIGRRGMGALEFEPVMAKESPSHDIELSDLIETTKALLSNKENVSIQTQKNMEDVMMDVLKMGTSAGGARPKALLLPTMKKQDKSNLDRRFQTKVLSIG